MTAESALSARRITITGGAGFIGRHVARSLRDAGAEVLVADLQPCCLEGVASMVGDLNDRGSIETVVGAGTDAVVHLAARTSVLGSIEHPAETFQTNVAMTAALLERARTVGVRTFVFASTNAVVGSPPEAPLDERVVLRPLTPYGASKAASEMLMSAYESAYGMTCSALRLTNVYGPEMTGKDSVVPRLLRSAAGGGMFDVYGDGHQRRDYVCVSDVVSAVRLALTDDLPGPLVIGSGRSLSVLELVDLAREVTGAPIAARHVPAKKGEMAAVRVDVSRAFAAGWQPRVEIEDGLGAVWASWPSRPA